MYFSAKNFQCWRLKKQVSPIQRREKLLPPETFFYRRNVFDLRSSASPHSQLPKSIKMLLSKISFQVHKIAIYHLNHDFYSILF